MLIYRVLTTLVLLGFLFVATFSGNAFFLIFLLFSAVFLAGSEFVALRWMTLSYGKKAPTNLSYPRLQRDHFGLGFAYAVNLPIAFLTNAYLSARYDISIATIFAWSTLSILLVAIYFYQTERSLFFAVDKIINGAMGFVYLSIPGLCALYLAQTRIEGSFRGSPLYFVLGTTASSDIGAYFIGRFLGRRPLLKAVSPSKTLEGSLGGIFVSALMGFFMNLAFHLTLHPMEAILLGLIAGCCGQLGDLFQSALKRVAKVKDSGYLLPGHGGALDRIDSHLFSLPILYLLFMVALRGLTFTFD